MKKNKYNDLKITWFPDKLRSFILGCVTPPIYVRIKPTNRCNHNCWFCVYNPEFAGMHSSMARQDELSPEILLNTINDLGSMEVKAITFSGGGEPLYHPAITDAFKSAMGHGIRISIITNGQLLYDERAELLRNSDWVRISADYYDEKSFTSSRKGSSNFFHRLIENLTNFGSSNKIADFGINFIINKNNIDYLKDAYVLFRDIGVDNIRFSPMWTANLQEYHSEIKDRALEKIAHIKENSDIEIYDSYSSVFNGFGSRSYTKCFIAQIVPVVAADGFIYACHNMSYEPAGKISDDNLKDASFKDIWYSDKSRKFFNTFNPSVQCRGQCSNDHKNMNIYDLLTGYGDPFI